MDHTPVWVLRRDTRQVCVHWETLWGHSRSPYTSQGARPYRAWNLWGPRAWTSASELWENVPAVEAVKPMMILLWQRGILIPQIAYYFIGFKNCAMILSSILLLLISSKIPSQFFLLPTQDFRIYSRQCCFLEIFSKCLPPLYRDKDSFLNLR